MAVQGGASRPVGGNPLVDDIMKMARSQRDEETSSSRPLFSGKPKKLTDEPVSDDEEIYAEESEEDEEEAVVRTITFWSEGFTIEPINRLRLYTDSASSALLTYIRSGIAPLSELGVRPGQHVEMRVVQRSSEEYTSGKQAEVWKEVEAAEGKKSKGKASIKPFSGSGRRLGDLPSVPTASPSQQTSTIQKPNSNESVGFDSSKNSTKIQIRLNDGTRHTILFNPDQTVQAIYETVNAIKPCNELVLLTGRPPKPLSADLQITIKDAGLEGSLIIQQ